MGSEYRNIRPYKQKLGVDMMWISLGIRVNPESVESSQTFRSASHQVAEAQRRGRELR